MYTALLSPSQNFNMSTLNDGVTTLDRTLENLFPDRFANDACVGRQCRAHGSCTYSALYLSNYTLLFGQKKQQWVYLLLFGLSVVATNLDRGSKA